MFTRPDNSLRLPVLELQLYTQLCQLPGAVEKALEENGVHGAPAEYVPFSPLGGMYFLMRSSIPMDVDSSHLEDESASDSDSDADMDSESDSDEDFARARPRQRQARSRLRAPHRRRRTDKENDASQARRPRTRGNSVVSYATASDDEDSEYVPSGSPARVKKGRGRARTAARATTRATLADATNADRRESVTSRRVAVHVPDLDSEAEASRQ